MKPIKLSFNLNKVEDIQNLVLVLGYITDEDFELEEYETGVLPDFIEEYLEYLKEKHGLYEEEELSPKVIQLINQLWMNKRYEDPIHIHQLHVWFKALDYEINKEEFEARTIGETTVIALTQAEQKYDLPITG